MNLQGITLFDPVALAIVGGGTAFAAVMRTAPGDALRGLGAPIALLRRGFALDPQLRQITALARIVQRHGVIALDRSVIADPDVAAAAAAIVDGESPEAVRAMLARRRTARFERDRAAAEFWAGAAEVAPAMGLVGTLIGLIQMFANMRDPAAIGGAMAVALLATLYGALFANLLAQPIAVRLRQRARREAQDRAMLEPALTALAASAAPSRATRNEMAA